MTVNYERTYWEDYPSKQTPINAENLNNMETGIAGLYSDVGRGVLYFQNLTVLATTGDICSYANAKIRANHVVAEAVWGNPSYITTDVTATTSDGLIVLNGTCTTATTVNLVLVEKQN